MQVRQLAAATKVAAEVLGIRDEEAGVKTDWDLQQKTIHWRRNRHDRG